MIWHSSDIDSVINELGTSLSTGLSSSEADSRLNKINAKIKKNTEKPSFVDGFTQEFKKPIYYLVLVTSVIALIFHFIFGSMSIIEPIAIFLLTLLKAALTAFVNTHYLYDIDKGKSNEKSSVKVLRNGESTIIDSKYLVPGDIIFVSEGDYIPADARLVQISDLHCDEFNVTGDSVPTQKNTSVELQDIAPVAERSNMIFAGSFVISGSGVAIVTEIADYTEYFKNTKENFNSTDFSLELEQRIAGLGKLLNASLGIVSCAIFLIDFIVSLVTKQSFLNSLFTSFFVASAALLAFMPSVISILATASISRGIRRMKKNGISIFNPSSIDSIAKLDVICADKTGTFTQNKMVLTKMFDGFNLVNVKSDTIEGEFKMLLRIAALCCNGEVKLVKGIPMESGDSTQTAIIAASMEHLGLSKYDLDNIYPRMAEIPFNPDRKLMTTVNIIDGHAYAIVRGSVEALIEKCSGEYESLLKVADEMSADNLRVVGVAMKPLNEYSAESSPEELECDLNFVGLLGLSDIPRRDSKEAVKACRKAGMKVVMITGDHLNTAFATAQKLRIAKDESQVISGEEIANLTDTELAESIEKYTVFARVTAEDRFRIVKAYKDNGHFVAITGDNALTTASIRTADIGYSMGKTGSDVAICSSEVVIEDDSFSSVVRSVRDCRGIFHNIAKASKFFLSASLGLVSALLLGFIFFGSSLFSPCGIIILASCSIAVMSLGIVYEAAEKEDINLIIDNNALIFNSKYLLDIVFNAAIFAIATLVTMSIGASAQGIESASSFTFVTMYITMLVSGLVLRTDTSFFKLDLSNKRIFIFAIASFLLLIVINFIPFPSFVPYSLLYWIYSIIIAVSTAFVLNVIKLIRG